MPVSKIIVAGGRDFSDESLVNKTLDPLAKHDVEIVCGEARGADYLGKQWALRNGKPVKSFPADWDKHGKKAGPIRNAKMAEYADHLIAFWDGESRGTANMIALARAKGLGVKVIEYH